jgi:hypothetical protein
VTLQGGLLIDPLVRQNLTRLESQIAPDSPSLRRGINAQTGTAYAVTDLDFAKIVVRNNGSASTQTWPEGAVAGTQVQTINRGAGTITHSAAGAATVIGTTSQAQWVLTTATSIGSDTWVLTT